MKISYVLFSLSVGLFSTHALVFANPALLPQHPGYPMSKAVDPVSGQSLANDLGQTATSDKTALSNAASFDDAHSTQHLLFNQNDERLLEKPGAGLLPKVQGPQITIDPPVHEGTKASAAPE